MSVNKYEHITMKDQCCSNELFGIGIDENSKDFFPLELFNLQR